MSLYPLQIVTPDGLLYDGEVTKVRVRTIEGDVGIMARHADFTTALGMGIAYINIDETACRHAACIGGLLVVINGKARIVATTFEWADEIDIKRAYLAREKAEEMIASDVATEDKKVAQSRLRRALIRIRAFEKEKAGE
jgi:ATP synthase, F1 epsilon subunit (delta in mitochondria)